MGTDCFARRAALLLCGATILLAACRGAGEPAACPDLTSLVKPGEMLLQLKRVASSPGPGSPGAAATVPELILVVVQQPDGKPELRIGEQQAKGWVQVHASSPGDGFRNLVVEDANADGRPEIVSTWTGGQLEVVEVLGRGPEGAWISLLQNAGEILEERRLADRTSAFWITSRTYEEEAGTPPIYDTTVYRWDGKAFSPQPGR